MNEVKLTDYLPQVEEISDETLLDVRGRIETYLRSRYADSLDMSPNSVFGDLILGPLAYLVASFEMAASRIFSDIDLANVAEGQIYNCDFVKEYLENFGLAQRSTTPATGVVQVSFSEPGEYILDASTSFLFTSEGKDFVFEMADVTDYLHVVYELADGAESENVKQLNRLDESEYVVNIPVIGPAGVSILKNTECQSSISIAQVTEVKSITDFDPGMLPENVMELANKTRNTYYAASLTSRNGCLSFLLQTYPELRGVSPVVSGDPEIIRTTENLFGVRQGVMDIFVKSKRNFITDYATVPLAYNPTTDKWQGLLPTPQGPPVRITDVKLTNSEESPESYEIMGRADESKYPDLAASYSPNETLGLYVKDSNGSTGSVDPTITPDFRPISNVGEIRASGQFVGYPFEPGGTRDIKLVFSAFENDFSKVYGTINYDGRSLDVVFYQTTSAAVTTYILDETADYNRFNKGVSFDLVINGNKADADFKTKLETALESENNSHIFSITPRTTNFLVTYEYDPTVVSIDSFVSKGDIKPINTDIQVRSFHTCEVSNITITYRSKSGSLVDTENARKDILSYVNGLSYPNLYEPFAVAELMLYYGADGVKSVTQSGKFARTVATKYHNRKLSTADIEEGNLVLEDMKDNYADAYEIIDTVNTTTLQPPEGIKGIGERNIHYIVSADSIVFDEVSF